MSNCQTIWLISLTSTSIVIIISYWLLAYFRVYFTFAMDAQHQTSSSTLLKCSQTNVVGSYNYFRQQIIYQIEWITLILAIICLVIQIVVIIMTVSKSKLNRNNNQSSQQQQGQKQQADSQVQLHIKSKLDDYHTDNNINNINQIQHNQPSSSKRQKMAQIRFILFFILFILFGTNIGHNIKIMWHSFNLIYANCPYNNNDDDSDLITNLAEQNIILVILCSYCAFSVIIRCVINLLIYTNKDKDNTNKYNNNNINNINNNNDGQIYCDHEQVLIEQQKVSNQKYGQNNDNQVNINNNNINNGDIIECQQVISHHINQYGIEDRMVQAQVANIYKINNQISQKQVSSGNHDKIEEVIDHKSIQIKQHKLKWLQNQRQKYTKQQILDPHTNNDNDKIVTIKPQQLNTVQPLSVLSSKNNKKSKIFNRESSVKRNNHQNNYNSSNQNGGNKVSEENHVQFIMPRLRLGKHYLGGDNQ